MKSNTNHPIDYLSERSIHRFSQRAMATVFEMFIDHDDRNYSQQAAYAAFEELHRLEQELSRYIESSDVSQINRSPADQPVSVSLDTLQCLTFAEKMYHLTTGAFDVTSGRIIDRWKTGQKPQNQTKSNRTFGLHIDQESVTVSRLRKDVLVDLGGIGKGYAIDCMRKTLLEWDIERAMLHSGWSTVLALAPPHDEEGWKLGIRHPETRERLRTVLLSHQTISGSGLQKGQHIIDPKTGAPVNHILAAWVIANDTVSADALSTTCMILPRDETKSVIQPYALNPSIFWDENIVYAETNTSMESLFMN